MPNATELLVVFFSDKIRSISKIPTVWHFRPRDLPKGRGRTGRALRVFRRPPDRIRAPVGRTPTLAKVTLEANEIHGNPKNHVRTIKSL